MTILLIIAIIIAVPLVLASFRSNKFNVERAIIIDRPADDVFNYIKYLKNQANYSKWIMTDPNVKLEYRGTDGTVGSYAAWDSEVKQVGKGEQTIANINEGHRLDIDLHFIKPYEGRSVAYMITADEPAGKTKVKWGFNSTIKYPMKVMHLFINMDKMIGNDLQVGLNNLKGVLEKR